LSHKGGAGGLRKNGAAGFSRGRGRKGGEVPGSVDKKKSHVDEAFGSGKRKKLQKGKSRSKSSSGEEKGVKYISMSSKNTSK